ncbi:MAG: hypothetical protein ABJN62_08035 [Halioglobus sp.]
MYRTYFLISALCTALLVIVVAAFCFLADPYDLYPSIDDNELDPDLFYHLRLHKPYAMESQRAEHLIVGSSRSARLPPAFLTEGNEASYNAALPGVTLREMRLLVEHAQAIQPLKTVVIGVDYYMFRQGHSEIAEHFEEERLRKVQPTIGQSLAHRFQRFEDNWRSLLSVDALINSWKTRYGEAESQRSYKHDGTWEAELSTQKSGSWFFSMLVRQKYQDFTQKTDQLDMTELNALLKFCDDHDIQTLVLISPFHASIMATVDMAGKWPQYIAWQRQVIRTSSHYANSARVLALERSPDLVLEKIDSDSRFFQDGVHYTSQAGRQLMHCLSAGECDSKINLVTLNSSNSASYLNTVTQLMESYRHSNPEDFAKVQKWLNRSN